jgi:hypothetical protein
MYVACTAYIHDDKCWSRDFPQSLYMAYTDYIYDEKKQVPMFLLVCTYAFSAA